MNVFLTRYSRLKVLLELVGFSTAAWEVQSCAHGTFAIVVRQRGMGTFSTIIHCRLSPLNCLLGLLSEEKNKTRQALFLSVVFYSTYLTGSSDTAHTHNFWAQYTFYHVLFLFVCITSTGYIYSSLKWDKSSKWGVHNLIMWHWINTRNGEENSLTKHSKLEGRGIPYGKFLQQKSRCSMNRQWQMPFFVPDGWKNI